MRIISKFHDFYDGVMKTGMDREVVYLREKKVIELDDDFGMDFTTDVTYSNDARLILLGYCGQIYKFYDFHWSVYNSQTLVHDSYRKIFFDHESFKEFTLKNGLLKEGEFSVSRWWTSSHERFRAFDTSKMVELFHRFQTPLFIVKNKSHWRGKGEATITLGPKLKDIDFQRFKDPYTTYQDIFQFVSGTLNRPETKMVKISDKDKIHKHGFDKWSFRQKGPKK